ncbi:alginate export family protein [Marinobacter alexandrii]|uniref:alginate export family protein n=2 Tax=Marinobacter alexandrii TaxID=2570351 RepID=UPI003265DF88
MRTKLFVAASAAAMAAPVQSVVLEQTEQRTIEANLEAMAGYFSASEDYLAEGGKDWQEAYATGTVVVDQKLANESSLYGGLGAIALGTFGDGDAAGFTTGDESDVDLENAYLGWRDREGILDVSVGRQRFQLGDGFLIAGDVISLGEGLDPLGVDVDRGGAYYLAGRKSFSNTAIFQYDPAGNLRSDLFWLQSDNPYQQDTELAGLNLEWVDDSLGTLGLNYLHVLDLDQGANLALWDQREGMDVVSVRGQGSLGIEDLLVSFEYVDQSGGDTSVENDAQAWYLETGWTFSELPWAPAINLRYATFSGDEADTSDNEAFDPLFFGFTRGFGTWFQGEVASNYAGPANSGNDVKRVEVTFAPRADLQVGAQFWDFSSNDDAPDLDGQEIDLYALWSINEQFVFSPLVGWYKPEGDDVEANQGNDDPNLYLQAVLMYFY